MIRRLLSILVVAMSLCVGELHAQSTSASITGYITDSTKGVIVGAKVIVINVDTNVRYEATTNNVGSYDVVNLAPGRYRIEVEKTGFKTVVKSDLILHVQDTAATNFEMALGSASEIVTVTAGGVNINTTDASVSTVIDRQFVENMPLNGRSFQDLLTLAPGVALVGNFGNGGNAGPGNGGEITVNGQRTEANNFTVDGVSVNTGAAAGIVIGGAGYSGSVPGESALGTTQSLVSVDALQEFRANTSTYSAEYGRTPGGQFSFSTRSGTNNWHGSLFDYFRNDVMDANNWFNNAATPQVPRLAERQNDFGGTLGGPIEIPGIYNGKDKTFFFFSYEGLRLTVPQPFKQYFVPNLMLRQQAPASLQPFLNAFAVPNGGEDGLNDGLAFYNLAYSSPSSLDSVGIRVDHNFGAKLQVFGRYGNAPSSSWTYKRPAFKQSTTNNVRTLTVGATSSLTSTQANDLRFNVTENNTHYSISSTNFGGATPLDYSNVAGPNGQPATASGTDVIFQLCFGACPYWQTAESTTSQRQYNVTDTYTWSHGTHQLKFGMDWRRLTTYAVPITNFQIADFASKASLFANSLDFGAVQSLTSMPIEPVYHNFSVFAQDSWKIRPRLSLSLGLRWDINPAPGNLNGPSPYTVDQITNLSSTKLASENTSLWNTDWHGFAPRLGVAYQLRQEPGHETVLRTGLGVFYDMGNTFGSQGFNQGVGFTSTALYFGAPYPFTSAQVTLPPPSVASPYYPNVYAYDPNLKLPYTMQWNLAVQQGLGANQTVTVGYVGSAGRRLLAGFYYFPGSLSNPNPNFSSGGSLFVTANRASSEYNALQLKYQKNLSHGLQALASCTFSHSIDDLSSNFPAADLLLRSSSDFDIRHNFQAAITYDIPGNYSNLFASAVLKHWGLDTRISARSSLPVDILGLTVFNPETQQQETPHPDLVAGQPTYLQAPQYPGGRIINYNAFTLAAAGADGNTPRNFARGFDAVQVDLALRRDFPIRERFHLQFRAEAFNVFNHTNFGSIDNQISDGPGLFGYANNTLNSSLGGLNPLYQVGGPRSLQLSLRLNF